MSQHKIELDYRGKTVEVLIGWDRPLQGYFLVVDWLDADTDEPIYSNLNDPAFDANHGVAPSLEMLMKRLIAMDIDLPATVIGNVLMDGVRNIGNCEVKYSKDGEAVWRGTQA
jgi:hypothetical protein